MRRDETKRPQLEELHLGFNSSVTTGLFQLIADVGLPSLRLVRDIYFRYEFPSSPQRPSRRFRPNRLLRFALFAAGRGVQLVIFCPGINSSSLLRECT